MDNPVTALLKALRLLSGCKIIDRLPGVYGGEYTLNAR